MTDVIGDVEAGVVDPDRMPLAGDLREALAEAGNAAEPGFDGAADPLDVEISPLAAERRLVEQQDASHVHVIVGVLEAEKRGIEGAEALVERHGDLPKTLPAYHPGRTKQPGSPRSPRRGQIAARAPCSRVTRSATRTPESAAWCVPHP